MADDILDQVQEFMFDDEFANTFERFAAENCSVFTDDEEQKLVYTEIYNKFCSLFEKKLEDFIKSKGVEPEEFFMICKKAQEDKTGDSEFIDILLSLSDYDVFLTMMRDEARRQRGGQ